MVEKFLDSCRDDGEHIIIKIEVNDVLEAEPFCIVKSSLPLLQMKWLELRAREDRYHSYRAQGEGAGRMLSFIGFRAVSIEEN